MTDQLTAWFMNGYLTSWLTDCLRAFWRNVFTYTLKYYVTNSTVQDYWPTHLMVYGWLIGWLGDSAVEGLNDLCWFIEQFFINWLHCLKTDQLTERFVAGWLTNELTLLSADWPTDRMIYGLLINWITDCTVWGLTNWLNDLWLVDWLNNWLYCQGTDQLVDWPSNWVYCLETDQLTEWFIAGWLTNCSVADSTVWDLTD